MKKFTIYIGNMVGITVEGESKKIVQDILIDNSKKLVTDLIEEGVITIEQQKVKQLRKLIKPIQVEWMKSLLPEEEANKVSLETIDELLPDEKYIKSLKGVTLLHMSDKWILKKLKKHPHITTYKQLKEELNV